MVERGGRGSSAAARILAKRLRWWTFSTMQGSWAMTKVTTRF
jgi:hypothetical protein